MNCFEDARGLTALHVGYTERRHDENGEMANRSVATEIFIDTSWTLFVAEARELKNAFKNKKMHLRHDEKLARAKIVCLGHGPISGAEQHGMIVSPRPTLVSVPIRALPLRV